MNLKGKVAVVTGSTRGIGLAIAQRLARNGMHIVINASSSKEDMEQIILKLEGGMPQHIGFVADISRPEAVEAMAKKVEDRFGRCDLLVNNAGFTKFIPHADLHQLSETIFDRTIAVNLKGPFLCVRAFESLLRRNPPGLIVNIASVAATTAQGSSVIYCACKAGLVNMTKSLARALAPDIRVNSVSPGLVDTELTKDFGRYREEQIVQTPLKRLGRVEDIAGMVLAIMTDMDFVTGHDFVVDGGRSCGS